MLMHTPRPPFCRMLGSNPKTSAACSLLRVSFTSTRDPSQRSVDCCSPEPVPHSPNIVVYDVLGFCIDSFASRPRESRMNQGRKIPNDAHILLRLPIDSVMSFLSTISSVVPVDSDPERD